MKGQKDIHVALVATEKVNERKGKPKLGKMLQDYTAWFSSNHKDGF